MTLVGLTWDFRVHRIFSHQIWIGWPGKAFDLPMLMSQLQSVVLLGPG
ncbi:UNVERIFIED_CONTAM: hypothetical protein GTU68_034549 [Idotea baltica]|nr:hypothetical protein [Idotea baltica]